MRVALAIPPCKARVPRGSLGPICESYGVGPEFPTKFWENVEKPRWTLPRRSTFGAAKGLDARRSSRQQRLRRCSRASTRSTTDTLERVWQSLVKVYNQTLRTSGDNDFSVEHSGVRVRQRAGTLERVVKYDVDAFKAAWDFLSDAQDG